VEIYSVHSCPYKTAIYIICPQTRVAGTLFLRVAVEIQEVVEILALSVVLVYAACAEQ